MIRNNDKTNFVFVEHKGHHGAMSREEQGCVRRHIANEIFRRKSVQRDVVQLPVVGETIFSQKPSLEGSSSENDVSEATDNNYEAKSSPDRLGVLPLPSGKSEDNELINHISSNLWPGFRFTFDGTSNPFPAFWLPRCIENPALYHALMFSALCHLSSRLSLAGQKPRDKGKLVSLETRALVSTRGQIGNESITDSPNALEDLIMITICLATNVRGENLVTARDPTPFYPILTSGRWLDTYGALASRNVHWNAVLQLVEKRGGIRKIASFGLPWVITW
jgi:hypothetical protein